LTYIFDLRKQVNRFLIINGLKLGYHKKDADRFNADLLDSLGPGNLFD